MSCRESATRSRRSPSSARRCIGASSMPDVACSTKDTRISPTSPDANPGSAAETCVDDAVVVGSGPNGFAAAIELARAGASVRLLEAKATIGGGMRTAALTLPGFAHDVCSGCHPMAVLSPWFRTLSLEEHGLHWIY